MSAATLVPLPPPARPSPRPPDLTYDHASLVVLAGLPGAGKTTLLERVRPELARQRARWYDPEQLRRRLPARLRSGPGYRLVRPAVHLIAWARVVAGALRPGPLVVHDPATRGLTRAALALLAALTGRTAHLLWIAVSPAQARAGQRRRGRVLAEPAQRRHEQRWKNLAQRLSASGRGQQRVRFSGYASTTVLDRRQAAQVRLTLQQPEAVSPAPGRARRGRPPAHQAGPPARAPR